MKISEKEKYKPEEVEDEEGATVKEEQRKIQNMDKEFKPVKTGKEKPKTGKKEPIDNKKWK